MTYPKQLTKKEFEGWFQDLEIPTKLMVTQLQDETILIQKINL